MKLALVGHSHIVALLDALGPWRTPDPAPRPGGSAPGFLDYNRDQNFGVRRLGERRLQDVGLDVSIDVTAAVLGRGADKTAHWADLAAKRLALSPWIRDVYEQIKGTPVIVCAVRGDEIWALMYGYTGADYQIAAEEEAYRPGVQPIDPAIIIEVVHHLVWKKVAPYLLPLGAANPAAKFIIVPPPPPVFDMTRLPYAEKLAKLLSAPIRMQWYEAQTRAYRDIFGAQAAVLAAPAAACDARGYLRVEFAEGVSHANAAYGALVWRDILRSVGALAPA